MLTSLPLEAPFAFRWLSVYFALVSWVGLAGLFPPSLHPFKGILRYAQASDILTQRLKAVHMSIRDGHWNRADHNELVPPDAVSMTSLLEEDMANKELPLRVMR